jgi:hypothetical protein
MAHQLKKSILDGINIEVNWKGYARTYEIIGSTDDPVHGKCLVLAPGGLVLARLLPIESIEFLGVRTSFNPEG